MTADRSTQLPTRYAGFEDEVESTATNGWRALTKVRAQSRTRRAAFLFVTAAAAILATAPWGLLAWAAVGVVGAIVMCAVLPVIATACAAFYFFAPEPWVRSWLRASARDQMSYPTSAPGTPRIPAVGERLRD